MKASGIQHLIDEPNSRAYFQQLNFIDKVRILTESQFKEYRPGCVNLLRVVEVTSLGALVGILFYDVGNDSSSTSLSQSTWTYSGLKWVTSEQSVP